MAKGSMLHLVLGSLAQVTLWIVTAVITATAINVSAERAEPKDTPPQQTVVESASTQAAQKLPVITKSTVIETRPVPFTSTTVNDTYMDEGLTEIRTAGVNGIRTLTYEVTTTDGIQSDKKLIKDEVTTRPTTQVTAIGTYVAPKPRPKPQATSSSCDPNYSGGCVPIASDVDCRGGSGNGPAYVSGPVYVIGSDIYGLDGDDDGVGCE